jgi:hypothetical protein
MLERNSTVNRVKCDIFRIVLFFLDHLLDYEYLLISGSSTNFPFLLRFLYRFRITSIIIVSLRST